MKTSLIVKVVLSALALLLALVVFMYPRMSGDEAGEITIELYDEDSALVFEDVHTFEENRTLFELLDMHYEIEYQYQRLFTGEEPVLLAVEDVETDFKEDFIFIEVNGVMAKRGVDSIELVDGGTYTLSVREVD